MEHNHKDTLNVAVDARDKLQGGGQKKNVRPDPLAEALRKNLQRRKQAVRSVATNEA